MRNLNIVARFPLGVYLGHKADGQADAFPDPARLHAALLNSAAQGTSAVVGQHGLEPSEESITALKWLEKNPPDAVEIPPNVPLSRGVSRFAYREAVHSLDNQKVKQRVLSDGVVKTETKKVQVGHRRMEQRAVSDGTAVLGQVGWRWDNVPNDIAVTLLRLCEDVPYLGEATSIAILESHEIEPTLRLNLEGSPLESGGMMLRVPTEGRTDALLDAYQKSYPLKRPSVAKDRVHNKEEPVNFVVPQNCLASVKYRDREPVSDIYDTPWSQVVLLEVSGEDLPNHQHVDICVALHRAVIAAIGFGASSLITGKYSQKGVDVPANRLAFQYLPSKYTAHLGVATSAIAVMIPKNADSNDLEQLSKGLSSVNRLWSRSFGRRSVYFNGHSVSAGEFWPPVAPGKMRLWEPLNAVVPETRPVSKKKTGMDWSLSDAGLLSMAYVWRDKFPTSEKGEHKYVDLRNQVESVGAFVFKAWTISAQKGKYTHRTHPNVVTQPWRGMLTLGNLANDQTIVAIGQSRHLGGGLLVPLDVATKDFEELIQNKIKEAHGNE